MGELPIKRYTEGAILSGYNDYDRTHLWRDRQGAEGANSDYGIISQAKGQRLNEALLCLKKFIQRSNLL